jgi:hypothetical protein
MSDVLDVVLVTFRCDRAWLIYPCDPEVDSHRVRMERTRTSPMNRGSPAFSGACWPRTVRCDSIPNQTVHFPHSRRSVSASSP